MIYKEKIWLTCDTKISFLGGLKEPPIHYNKRGQAVLAFPTYIKANTKIRDGLYTQTTEI